MRYGATPQNVLEWLALKLEQAPLPVLDTLIGPLQARVLIAAVRSGVLAALGQGARSCMVLATTLSLDADCLQLLLRVLAAMGYVEEQAGEWRLSRVGARYFGAEAKEPYSAFVAFGEQQWQLMSSLEEVLRTGRGVDFHASQDSASWQAYQRAMLENAESFASFVAEHVPVTRDATRCLDLAGAHGLVGAELCRRHPGLVSTVLDRPEALVTAEALARARGYGAALRFHAGDLLTDPLPGPQDVILLCNILHHFSEQTNLSILQRARAALVPGGTVAVFDIETPREGSAADAAGDGMALYFRITSSSRCVRGEEYARWLEQSGFRTHIVRSIRLPSRVLIVGRAA